MNIALIGYRGTGKSAVAAALASQTGLPCVSTDAEIVRRAGCSIAELVAAHGWDAFRDIEQAVVADLAQARGAIIDCGGGIVVRPENIAALKERARIVWLKAPIPVIADRIRGDVDRPVLTSATDIVSEIRTVLQERTPLYEGASDFSVDTTMEEPAAIARAIAQWAKMP